MHSGHEKGVIMITLSLQPPVRPKMYQVIPVCSLVPRLSEPGDEANQYDQYDAIEVVVCEGFVFQEFC